MKTKTFDCVEMNRAAAERIHGALKNMKPDEKLEYWRKRSQELRREVERSRAAASSATR